MHYALNKCELKKVLVALAVALLIVFAVRALAFTVYTVSTDVSPRLKRGDRVMVNRLERTNFKHGDMLVFRYRADLIGEVRAVPGDTVALDTARYVIPRTCCARCVCDDCRLYLVDLGLGHGRVLVHKHEVVGRAYRLFSLPF